MPKSGRESIVILVDNRIRDLDVAALIAVKCEARGVPTHLVPLEAYKAVLDIYRPGLILFNHVNASHIATYTRRLNNMGIKAAVLLNEGLSYQEDDRRYLVEKRRTESHVDLYLAWNEPYAEMLRTVCTGPNTQVEVVGIPRFDFYQMPEATRTRAAAPFPANERKNVLFCTNFVAAQMQSWTADRQDGFFLDYAKHQQKYQDYREAIACHWRSRERFPKFLEALARSRDVNIMVRPHPSEEIGFYEAWYDGLDTELRGRIALDRNTPIAGLIADTDLHVSCETCTTALEAWILGKPTISLTFEKHPFWHEAIQCDLNVECAELDALPALADNALQEPIPAALKQARHEHLQTWCGPQDGQSADRVAELLTRLVLDKPAADWSQLRFEDRRRAARLRLTNRLDLAYHFTPMLPVRRLLGRTTRRIGAYDKSITPRDAHLAMHKMRTLVANAPTHHFQDNP